MSATIAEPETEARIDPRLARPLDRLRGLLRRYLVAELALFVAIAVVAWLLLDLVLDYGVFAATNFDWALDATPRVRVGMGASLLGLVSVPLYGFFRLSAGNGFSYPALAMLLEKRFPAQLGERLVTAVELADEERFRPGRVLARHGPPHRGGRGRAGRRLAVGEGLQHAAAVAEGGPRGGDGMRCVFGSARARGRRWVNA